MAITAKAQVTNPDDAVLELTVSATVGEWRVIMRDLDSGMMPCLSFGNVIARAIGETVGRVSHATGEVDPY